MDGITLKQFMDVLAKGTDVKQVLVISCDQMDRINLDFLPAIVAINTEESNSNESNSHWIGLYIFRNKTDVQYEFFCSMGNGIDAYDIAYPQFFKENRLQVQQNHTYICSLYVLFFLHHKIKGLKFSNIQSKLCLNQYKNDIYVLRYLQDIFIGKQIQLQTFYNIKPKYPNVVHFRYNIHEPG